ncbi:putative retrieval receptor for endoplasmic reticulum membrane protein [Fasciolopsis buskii]|uniref:Protein RER1 n=1 Tax=Fasciolopsis buskii TaxID=27845 RepID=A0A8E0VNX3_9TREM|nr:putative retrieval receptor for endoplasmic reticulum membrane protein [Fasciolopsis buski]
MDYYQSEPPSGFTETPPSLRKVKTIYQSFMDSVTPYLIPRWVATGALFIFYWFRVLLLQGFHVVSYALAIFLLNRLIGFLSPMIDPDMDPDTDPVLPMKSSEDFRPFLRRLPELKVWNSCTLALIISVLCTFFPFLDIPVFWPILVIYFLLLFYLTMKRQIMHMIKYRYLPFTYGKPRHQSSTAHLSRH